MQTADKLRLRWKADLYNCCILHIQILLFRIYIVDYFHFTVLDMFVYIFLCLQCFHNVDRVAGRASGL